MNVRRVDLNLLRVFDAVLRHRSIVGASRELSITPSAVSHALARLRSAISDPLFVAAEAGMEPTPRALELAPHVSGALLRIDTALQLQPFDPAQAVRTFRIAMSEYAAGTVLPPLLERLRQCAPNVDLRVFPFSRADTVRQVDDGRLDLVVGWFAELPPRMRRALLWQDVESLIARPDHPLTRREVTRDSLFEFPHIVVELTGSGDQHDEGFLDDRGVFRRVWVERLLLDTQTRGGDVIGRAAVSVPHYSVVIPIVRRTDLLATLPRRYCEDAVRRGHVAWIPLPYEPVVGRLEAVWHQRGDADAALQWLVAEAQRATGASAAAEDDSGRG